MFIASMTGALRVLSSSRANATNSTKLSGVAGRNAIAGRRAGAARVRGREGRGGYVWGASVSSCGIEGVSECGG